jgi:hypothetical protein
MEVVVQDDLYEQVTWKKRYGCPIVAEPYRLEDAREEHLDATTVEMADRTFLLAGLAADDEPLFRLDVRGGHRHAMGGSKFNAIDPSMGAEALIFFSI